MKVNFPMVRRSEDKATLDKLSVIAGEVPVTFSHNGSNIPAEAASLLYPHRSFPVTLPKGSVVDVHDSGLCKFEIGRDFSFDSPRGFDADAIITYVRPVSRTGSYRLTYTFPIKFLDNN